MRCAGWIALVSLIGMLAVHPVAGQGKDAKDKDKDKAKYADPPSYIQNKTLKEWIVSLKSPDPSVRQQAVQVIVNFGPAAKEAVPMLIAMLRDTDVGLRADAAAALGMIGAMDRGIDAEEVNKVVQGLAGRVGAIEPQGQVRLQAVLAIAQIGPRARGAVTALTDASRDGSSWQLRKAICYALGRVGIDAKGPDPKAMGTLLGSLKDPAGPVRFEAILALSAMGLSPRPAEVDAEKKALEAMLNDHDKNIAIWSRVLLMFLDERYLTEKSLGYLSTYLRKENDPKVRATAARAIGTLGGKAKILVPDLFQAMNSDKDLDVILTTISALGMMTESSPQVMPELRSRLVSDPEAAIRAHTAGVLGNLGEGAKAALPDLIGALRDKETAVVFQVLATLARLGATASPALPTLDDLAKNHKEESVKRAAEDAAKHIREMAATVKKKPDAK